MGRAKAGLSNDSWFGKCEFGIWRHAPQFYMDSPNLLEQTYRSKKQANLFFAGQMTGVEGCVESAASGLVAGINAARLLKEKKQRFSQKQQRSEVWLTILPMPTASISNP